MKIRSITYFCNPGWPLEEKKLQAAGAFLAQAKSSFEAVGYEVQTTRLATVPFLQLLGADKIGDTPKLAEELSGLIQEAGISFASLGPAQPEIPASYEVIPDALQASKNIFFSGVMADTRFGISLSAVNACAAVIVRLAPLDPRGFANLNFAALANVKPGSPFFPASYHNRNEPTFAVATEAADLAVEAFGNAKSVTDGQWALVEALEEQAGKIASVGDVLSNGFSIGFGGIDFSLAPFPSEAISIGNAIERMGVPKVGLHGSLAAAAILTECIDRARYPRAGFSGLMLPVLEDAVLAKRAAEGTLSVKDLLLYSAVCGTGLDTVPLPGKTTTGQIAALLIDIAALSLRLDKPLTARLMPVPHKKAGDRTGFDFDFFANSRVMALDAEDLTFSLAETRRFNIAPRHPG
jgi:uncharacterized protein (UPF0210 family)